MSQGPIQNMFPRLTDLVPLPIIGPDIASLPENVMDFVVPPLLVTLNWPTRLTLEKLPLYFVPLSHLNVPGP